MKPIDIAPTDLATVQSILSQHVPSLEARAFGSRVSWNARSTSDLDLALLTTVPLDFTLKADLREAFAQSALPFRVDIVDWAATSEDFREVIEQEYVVLQDRRKIDFKNNDVWREIPLKDIAEIIMGQSPPSSTYNALGSGLPFFQGVKDFGYRHPTPRVYCSVPSRIAKPGDILFSVRAPIGRVNIADRKCATGRGLAIVKPFDSSEARFLEFVLKNMAFQWEELEAGGSVFGNATKKDLERLSILWPCHKQERKTIAHILGTLDDKIALNHQMNQTLEEIVQALFKSWFIDFDPVTAKLEKRWQSKQSLSGLHAEIYDLFPDCLVESRLGKIPRGWAVQPLRECFRLKMGQSPPGNTYNKQGEGIPFFQGRTEFGFRFPENRKFCTKPIRFAVQGDTLVSVRAPVGDMNVAREQCCIGRGIAALRHRSGSSSFTYYYASLALQQELQQFDHTGTVFGSINKNRFEALNVIEPSLEIVDAFDTLAKPLDRKILINYSETKALISLKNILLPCLMSGQYSLL